MTDFVIKSNKEIDGVLECNEIILKYAEFLKQPLTLGMFVPCDKKGNVLKGKPLSPAPDSEWIRWENEEFEFYEAKEKVLFKGFNYKFNVDKDGKKWEYVKNEFPHVFSFEQLQRNTVETLLTRFKEEYLIELTESVKKQIYGDA